MGTEERYRDISPIRSQVSVVTRDRDYIARAYAGVEKRIKDRWM